MGQPSSNSGRRDAGRPRGDQVVAAVLAAVRAELAEHGFGGLSVDRVARRAEVNKTSVYRRWPTREELVAAAMLDLRTDLAISADTGSFHGDLMDLARNLAQFIGGREGTALLRASIATGASEQISFAVLRESHEHDGPVFAMVERARRRGEWREDADPGQAIFMLVGAIMHRTLLENADATGPWLDSLVDLVHRSVAVSPAEHRG